MKPNMPTALTCVAVALLAGSCIDAKLTDAELDEKIDQQSQAYPTAVLLADCLGRECQANSNTCYETCSADASKEAKELGDPLWSCWKAKCHSAGAGGGELQDMTKCLMLKCAPELQAIIEPKKTGATDCPGTLNCMELCDPTKSGLFTCYQQCFDEATEVGRAALGHWGDCASKTTDDPTKACHAEVVACHAGIRLDSGKCVTIAPCAEACSPGKGNDACTLQCRDKLDDAGKQKFDELLPCFSQGMASAKCTNAAISCIEPSGKASCLDTYRCTEKCQAAVSGSKDKIGCLYSCMHNGTGDSADAIMKAGHCQQGGDADTCTSGLLKCSQPNGEKGCADIIKCNNTCKNGSDSGKFLCLLECMHDGKPKAAQAYMDVLTCYAPCEANCGNGKGCKDKCDAQCKQEVAACIAN